MVSPEMASQEMISREMLSQEMTSREITGSVMGPRGRVRVPRGMVWDPHRHRRRRGHQCGNHGECHGSARLDPETAGYDVGSAAVATATRSFSSAMFHLYLPSSLHTYLSHACSVVFALQYARCNPLTCRNKRQMKRNNLNDFI